MTKTFASLARLALFAFAIAPGCGGDSAQGSLGHAGDLCHVGNIATSETPASCGPGLECPAGNPDVSRYCVETGGQAGELCYAGNIATHPPVVTCGPGLVCPAGNPDVSRYCVAASE
jgi:hypothetical protein